MQFLGQRTDLQSLLALADVFVLPSAWEGMPNVVMEAMAAGCPVIATRIDGTTELIPDESFGRLVTPDDAEELASALAEVLADRPQAQARAARARERVAGLFGVNRMLEGYETLFEELARAR